MRIIQIGKYYPPPFGGMEYVLYSLVEQLKHDCDIDVIVSALSKKSSVTEERGYRVYRLATPFHFSSSVPISPKMPILLWEICKKNQVDIVHIHLPNPMAHFSSLLLSQDIKIIVSWHSDIIRQKRLFKVYRPFLNQFLRRVNAIVTATPVHFTSSAQLNSLQAKQYVVPFGIDIDRFSEIDEKDEKVCLLRQHYDPDDGGIVFALGRHVYYKGFEYLLCAMVDNSNIKLILGGQGPLTGKLRLLADQLGISKRVFFVGTIPDSDKGIYYKACDVFCLPSVEPSEAFGIVQVEAMACRKAVICCQLHNGVNYVNRDGETGLVVPPCDVDSLRDAIKLLISNKQMRTEMGEKGYMWVKQQFSLELMKEKMLSVYRSVLSHS